ncbi:hypothetical protein KI387_025938 [Taxus chinensis]|uniref:Uncharacterized protein n=1 Tax=Taxus chinensis TaxID=29808 RepID=A0AA38FXI1_TAXCH|nr:hypothetical protein KI387_025938 [Taxus chinensis]
MAAAAGLPMTAFNSCLTTSLIRVGHNRTHHVQVNPYPKLTLCLKKIRWRVRTNATMGNDLPQKQRSFKDFMEEIKTLGRIRIIVNTGVGVLESVTRMDNLFYHTLEGRGEYANVMNKDENVDFHLLVDKVKGAKLVQGKSKKNDTYMIRFMDDKGDSAASFLVMWNPNTDCEYEHGQVEAFQDLLNKYGSDVSFA